MIRKCVSRLVVATIMVAFILPGFSSAATMEELQAQIQALLAQIQSLQSQLAQQGGGGNWCYNFNTNLKFGDGSGVDAYKTDIVHNLQTALEKEGFTIDAAEKKGGAVFEESTASAVSGFQEKYRSEILTPAGLNFGNGFVGRLTRAKLNKLYGCGTMPTPTPTPIPTPTPVPTPMPTSTASIKVLSPNGGENFVVKTPVAIKWTSGNPGIARIDLLDGNGSYKETIYSQKVFGYQVPNTGGYFSWMPYEAGTYYVKIYEYLAGQQDNAGRSDTSDAPFNISAANIIKATDSDSSPDHSQYGVGWPITKEKYPDLFVFGTAKGNYAGNAVNYIYGQGPDPLIAKPTTNPYSTYFDHCANEDQLNEGFIQGNGTIGSIGVALQGQPYKCVGGVLVERTSQPVITTASSKGGSDGYIDIGREAYINGSGFLAGADRNLVHLEGNTSFKIWATKVATANLITVDIPSNVPAGSYRLSVGVFEGGVEKISNGYAVKAVVPVVSPDNYFIVPQTVVSGSLFTLGWSTSGASRYEMVFSCPTGTSLTIDTRNVCGTKLPIAAAGSLAATVVNSTATEQGVSFDLRRYDSAGVLLSQVAQFTYVSPAATPNYYLRVLYPNGGEAVPAGSANVISIGTNLIKVPVNLNLYKDGQWYQYLATITSSGSSDKTDYQWNVPMTLPAGAYTIEASIKEGGVGSLADKSDAPFSVIIPGASLFRLTANAYPGNSDLSAAVQNELGSQYKVADWNDIKAYFNNFSSDAVVGTAASWADALGIADGGQFQVTKDGQRAWGSPAGCGTRYYFVQRDNAAGKPGYFLAHDHIGDNYLLLGSWCDLNMKVLALNNAKGSRNTQTANVLNSLEEALKSLQKILGL